jgi:hypothetical protein
VNTAISPVKTRRGVRVHSYRRLNPALNKRHDAQTLRFSKVNAVARGNTRDLRVLWALEEMQLRFELIGMDHLALASVAKSEDRRP